MNTELVELLDLLRCINPHEDTWLVASLKAVSSRFVLDGTLGCPTCTAKYSISRGVGDFSAGAELPRHKSGAWPTTLERQELATRAGAFLNVTEPGATVVLGGRWASAAQDLSVMSEVRVLALNAESGVEESETVGLLLVGSVIPVAPASVLGVAIDSSFPPGILASAVKAVRDGGRILGPTEFTPPSELLVIAHDKNYWVAEKAPELITLRRSKPTP